MEENFLNWDLGNNNENKFIIEPSVICSIIEYQSRQREGNWIKGILLGKKNIDHYHVNNWILFEIEFFKNSIQIDEEYILEMIDLEKQKFDIIPLGWFTFSNVINNKIIELNKYLSKSIIKSTSFMENGPLILLFDNCTDFKFKGYFKQINKNFIKLFVEFKEVNIEVNYNKTNYKNIFDNIFSIDIDTSNDQNDCKITQINTIITNINNLIKSFPKKLINDNNIFINNYKNLLLNFNKIVENKKNLGKNNYETFLSLISYKLTNISTEIINLNN